MFEGIIITTTAELAKHCKKWSRADHIAIDTEFIREKTYYPHLCLMQIAGPDNSAIVDPLAEGIDLTPLLELLQNPDVIKVFHAGKQDVEIFYHLHEKIPTPIFDTQVAAEFCGLGESISYSDMIRRLLGTPIDKGSRFTDWAHRPLSDKQLNYAISDVIHLHEAYEILVKQLEKSGRIGWVQEEMASLRDIDSYRPDPENVWQRLKTRGMRGRSLAALQYMAKWREKEAMKRDVPRNRILRDEALIEVASSLPKNEQSFQRIRATKHLSRHQTEALLAATTRALALSEDELPIVPRQPRGNSASSDCIQMLQMLLAIQCRRNDLVPRLVARRDDLEALAAGKCDLPLLQDWRREIFGSHALKLLEGKLCLGFDEKTQEATLTET